MNGLIKKAVAGLCLGGGLLTLTGPCLADDPVPMNGCGSCGCDGRGGGGLRKMVDPCWPERYNYMARDSVMQTLGAQTFNGHVLDQTVWNYFFDPDPKTGRPTDKLNALGMQHLTYLARRRPTPDPKVYLQTAQDIVYNQNEPADKFTKARAELNKRRIQAVYDFLQAQTAARNLGYAFEVAVHDPAEVGMAAIPMGGNQPATIYRVFGGLSQLFGNFTGVLPLNAGGAYGTSGGAAGGGMGGGGGGGGAGGGGGGAGAGPVGGTTGGQ